jgi:hypothetical protein
MGYVAVGDDGGTMCWWAEEIMAFRPILPGNDFREYCSQEAKEARRISIF